MSDNHKCEVVEITEFTKHPNADRLVCCEVFGGFPCVVPIAWQQQSLFVYFPPDSLVPVDREEFAFLAKDPMVKLREDGTVRIKARKFRGQTSMGLLIPAPAKAKVGADMAEHYGVGHWNPAEPKEATPKSPTGRLARLIARRTKKYRGAMPNKTVPYYDIDNIRKHPHIYEGTIAIVTEKLHGTNCIYLYEPQPWWKRLLGKPQIFVRSRTVWRRFKDGSVYARAITPIIVDWIIAHPHMALIGEIVGPGVQKGFTYGCTEPTFFVFDIFNTQEQRYMGPGMLADLGVIPKVPVVYVGPYDFEQVKELSEGASRLAEHLREGVVVQPLDKIHPRKLKCVGTGYYEKVGDEE